MRSRVMVAVVSCLVTAAVVGGFAVAAIPNGNTINACRNNTTFVLRVIDKDLGQTCTSSETALSWTSWKWRGSYSSSASYKVGDVVQSAGSSYLAKGPTAPPVGVGPTNASYWAVVAAKGDVGATGPQGPKGDPAPVAGTVLEFPQTNVPYNNTTSPDLGPVDTSACSGVSLFWEIAPGGNQPSPIFLTSWIPGASEPLGFGETKSVAFSVNGGIAHPILELTGGSTVWTVGPLTGARFHVAAGQSGVIERAGIYCIPRV